MTPFQPVVLLERGGHPMIVYAKGRVRYRAVAATDSAVKLVDLETLRGLLEMRRKGELYPVKRAASFWLNRDFRPVTKRAKAVLRGLVQRK